MKKSARVLLFLFVASFMVVVFFFYVYFFWTRENTPIYFSAQNNYDLNVIDNHPNLSIVLANQDKFQRLIEHFIPSLKEENVKNISLILQTNNDGYINYYSELDGQDSFFYGGIKVEKEGETLIIKLALNSSAYDPNSNEYSGLDITSVADRLFIEGLVTMDWAFEFRQPAEIMDEAIKINNILNQVDSTNIFSVKSEY